MKSIENRGQSASAPAGGKVKAMRLSRMESIEIDVVASQQREGSSDDGSEAMLLSPCGSLSPSDSCSYEEESPRAESLPRADYLETTQPELNARMRRVLVDWLVEVAEEFKLSGETLFLAVNYLDRFCGAVRVPRRQYQLLGVTCMWIAAKYEEVRPPHVADFVDMTDNTYRRADILALERGVLGALSFAMAARTASSYLPGLLRGLGAGGASAAAASPPHPSPAAAEAADARLAALAEYILEAALADYGCLALSPPAAAAGALQLAAALLRHPAAGGHVPAATGLSGQELSGCVAALARAHAWACAPANRAAVRAKYSAAKYHGVSAVPPLPLL